MPESGSRFPVLGSPNWAASRITGRSHAKIMCVAAKEEADEKEKGDGGESNKGSRGGTALAKQTRKPGWRQPLGATPGG